MKIKAISHLPRWSYFADRVKIDKATYNKLKDGEEITVTKADAVIFDSWTTIADGVMEDTNGGDELLSDRTDNGD